MGKQKGLKDIIAAVKLPFPLTIRFKSMLQSGVATRDLDVRWVSSLSWYFLNLFGLQSVFIFLLGDENGSSSSFTRLRYMLTALQLQASWLNKWVR